MNVLFAIVFGVAVAAFQRNRKSPLFTQEESERPCIIVPYTAAKMQP